MAICQQLIGLFTICIELFIKIYQHIFQIIGALYVHESEAAPGLKLLKAKAAKVALLKAPHIIAKVAVAKEVKAKAKIAAVKTVAAVR